MTKKNERTGAFKYCARLIGEVLAAREGDVVTPEKLKVAIWRAADLEDKADQLTAGIDYVAQELAANPEECVLSTGGLITRIQDSWKTKIQGYVFIAPKDEAAGNSPARDTAEIEALKDRIRELERIVKKNEVEMADMRRRLWGNQAPLFGEEKTG